VRARLEGGPAGQPFDSLEGSTRRALSARQLRTKSGLVTLLQRRQPHDLCDQQHLIRCEKEQIMAETASSIYRVTEIIGTSSVSWEEAAKNAVETAGKSLRDLRVAEVSKLDLTVEEGKVVAYRARMSLSFKYEG